MGKPGWKGIPGGILAMVAVLIAGLAAAATSAQVPAEESSIQGTVTGPRGEKLSGICVRAFEREGWSDRAETVEGSYRFALAPGTYSLSFTDCSRGDFVAETYDDQAQGSNPTWITVRAGENVTGIDAALIEGGSITGTVSAADGADLKGATVGLTPPGQYGYGWSTTVDANGNFEARGIPPGRYSVGYAYYGDVGNYLPEYYSDSRWIEGAALITITAGQRIGGLDAVLTPSSDIVGTAVDASGEPAEGVCVTAYSTQTDWYDPYRNIGQGRVDEDGHYDFIQLWPGSYWLVFEDCTSRGWVREWYQDAYDSADAGVISVGAGEVKEVDDIVLERTGTITGRVMTVDGQPVDTGCVSFSWLGDGPRYYEVIYAEEDGTYTSPLLRPGPYRVTFNGCSARRPYYASQVYPRATGNQPGTPVIVRAQHVTTDIDGALSTVEPGGRDKCVKATKKADRSRKRLRAARKRLRSADGRPAERRAKRLIKIAKQRTEHALQQQEVRCEPDAHR